MDQKFHFDENIEPFTFQPTYQFFPEGEDIEMKLYASLKESLNYILSKENIPDFFPNVVFDSMETQDIFIDLKDILNVPLIENMTTDKNFVIKVIQENKKYTIDENNFVKVNLSDRTTIMLRDIPEGTLPEEIKNLFGEFAEQIANMEPEIGNNYYVNFDTTEIAQNAFNHVRTKTFNGKNVGCCITTNFTKKKNFNFPYVYVPPEYQENPYKNYNNDYKDGKKKFNRKRRDFRGRGGPPNNSFRGRSRGGRRNENPPELHIGEYWPPLPSSQYDTKNSDLKKYTREQIVEVIDSLKDIKPPVWDKECVGISEQMNTELEIGKVLPNSYKSEWVEKVRGKKNTQRVRSNSGKRDEVQNNSKLETSSIPVWPGRYKQKEYVVKQPDQTLPFEPTSLFSETNPIDTKNNDYSTPPDNTESIYSNLNFETFIQSYDKKN